MLVVQRTLFSNSLSGILIQFEPTIYRAGNVFTADVEFAGYTVSQQAYRKSQLSLILFRLALPSSLLFDSERNKRG